MIIDNTTFQLRRPKCTSEWAVEVVRDAIFAGKLKPGERLVEAKLAKELGVGISPVREALQGLEYLGLVTRRPNRGSCVTELSEQDVHQIYRLRCELEGLSVGYALEMPVPRDVTKLRRCADELVASARAKDYQKFFECDVEFHSEVCRLARDPFLERCLVSLTTPLFAFVLISLQRHPILFDFEKLAQDHQRIVDLFKMTDPAAARAEMANIMHGFREAVLEKVYRNRAK